MSVIFSRSSGIFHLTSSRTFLSFRWGKKNHMDRCKNKKCEKKLKPLFYEMFGEDAAMPTELKKLCDMEKEYINMQARRLQPNFSRISADKEVQQHTIDDHIPGIKYKTCGSTILLQENRNLPEIKAPSISKEVKRLQWMEAHPSLKEEVDKPASSFTTVEQRMIDLSDRKLHPLYLKMQTIPKRRVVSCEQTKPCTSNQMLVTPKQIQINRNLLEKKNILVDLKRTEPPKEIIQKELEQKLKHMAQLKKIPMK